MLVDRPAIDRGSLPGPRLYPSGAMVSHTSGHGESRLPHERSRRFFGDVSRGEMLGAKFIADGRDEVLTATRENLRAGASQIKVMAAVEAGVTCIEHGPLLDQATMKLLGEKGIWLSLQALDEAPPTTSSS